MEAAVNVNGSKYDCKAGSNSGCFVLIYYKYKKDKQV